MAGRFPLYADADLHGPVVEGLRRRGWDVVRAVELYPEGEKDHVHFDRAARDGRVLVSNDRDQLRIAKEWIAAGRGFHGLVIWSKTLERQMSVGDILAAFELLAARDDPFSPYPIVFIKPRA